MKNALRQAARLICILLLLPCLFVSCQPGPAAGRLEAALEMAGENRAELETVLDHYRSDSLKWKAAAFLIENMSYYYSYEGDLLDSLHVALEQFCDSARYDEKRFGYLKRFPYRKLAKVSDLHAVTADYLIENIEYSFKVWRERPWGKYISFDDFCEFILPYRIQNEPLTHWKKDLYERYAPVLDSLYGGTDVVEACTKMNRYLTRQEWNYIKEFNDPHLPADYLVEHRVGDCEDMSDYAVYVMRAVGIPVAKDTYFFSPANMYGHCWNALLDTTGLAISFFNETADPQRGKQLFYTKGKVYRYCYGVQRDRMSLLAEGHYVPRPLNNFSLKDVSADYFPTGDIYVDCDYMDSPDPCPVWMATFTPWGWMPIGVGEYKDGRACFHNVEPGFYYAVLAYDEKGRSRPAGPAFRLDAETGQVVQLRPEGNSERLVLRRKYPLPKRRYGFLEHMLGGRFEAANRADFSDARVLHRIEEVPAPKLHEVALPENGKYRYVRYLSDTRYPADIAELYWYARGEDKPLKGRLMHTLPEKRTEEFYPSNVQDGDRLTYFTSKESPGWIGLDLGRPESLGRIAYMPRNDDNYICPGHVYELFYLSRSGWTSLGRKTADSEELVYDHAPKHALFWLRDRTSGKEEHVFTYAGGKQYFNLREIIY